MNNKWKYPHVPTQGRLWEDFQYKLSSTPKIKNKIIAQLEIKNGNLNIIVLKLIYRVFRFEWAAGQRYMELATSFTLVYNSLLPLSVIGIKLKVIDFFSAF